jgi:hypothetical protein
VNNKDEVPEFSFSEEVLKAIIKDSILHTTSLAKVISIFLKDEDLFDMNNKYDIPKDNV